MSYTKFLKTIPAFRSLASRELDRLASQCEPATFKAGEQIIKRGGVGDAMFVIQRGEVKIPIVDDNGREKFVARLGPGEFFGEMALLTGESRNADVYAESDVECLVIRREPLQAFLHKNTAVASFLTEILGQRLMQGDSIRQVGKYKLVGELGRGGMAMVFEGLHPQLHTAVAIKMLSHELVYDEEFAARFKEEAKILAGLEHENIVQVIDQEEAFATFFIIMEKISGTVLSRMIDTRGVIPFEETRSILGQLAGALDYAHVHGIIHRDIKPANVIIEPTGRVKLMDFGIAKTRAEAEQEDEDIVGTAEYMSPEQALGRKMDGRADLYSLGIVAYEMLTGRLPFDSPDPYEILRKHVREEVPSPAVANPRVPADLVELVRRCCAKKPEDRFQRGDDVTAFLKKDEDKGVDLSKLRSKVFTVIYDPTKEEAVTNLFRRSLAEARKIPGVTVGISDLSRLY